MDADDPSWPVSPAADEPVIAWADDARRLAFEAWLTRAAPPHRLLPATLRPASSDASHRRYFRIDADGEGTDSEKGDSEKGNGDGSASRGADATSFIVMDAPPLLEDVRPFIRVAGLLHAAGLNAPEVVEADVEHGFLLLTDLGSTPYLAALQAAVAAGDARAADALMRDAIAALVRWQTQADAGGLPPYDDALLRRELQLFPDWCVATECGVTWSTAELQTWQAACDLLVRSALDQPCVAVHRDYMPRNLMVCAPNAGNVRAAIVNPGILDFQDAVRGPLSYDIASLLRDAFISWDEAQEIDWAVRYWQAARAAGLAVPDDFGEFWRQLEWMGLQRHLKVLGIFCRLKHRDAKPRYSEDLPRFFAYAHKVAARYNALRPLSRLLEPLMGAQRIEAFG